MRGAALRRARRFQSRPDAGPDATVDGLDIVSTIAYDVGVTASELKRWLKKQGCSFEEGAKHTKVTLKGKVTRMPRHPSAELKVKTLKTILKELGLEM
jgi:mRNA interferase HicA